MKLDTANLILYILTCDQLWI